MAHIISDNESSIEIDFRPNQYHMGIVSVRKPNKWNDYRASVQWGFFSPVESLSQVREFMECLRFGLDKAEKLNHEYRSCQVDKS